MISKERRAEIQRSYYKRHHSNILAKERLRWKVKRSHLAKKKRFGDRKCKTPDCEILMGSPEGAKKTRNYCFTCSKNKKEIKNRANRKRYRKWTPERRDHYNAWMREYRKRIKAKTNL